MAQRGHPQKRELVGGSLRKKKSPAKKSGDKYCPYHKFNSSHTTAECYMLKMKKSGREIGPRTCHVCGSKDHLQHDCPHMADCEDVDPATGETGSLRRCFNCGGKGHRPCDCAYRLARWRMGKNAKLFFNALNEGTEFVPIRPGPESLKANASMPHANTPRSSSLVMCTPVATKLFWRASVTGPATWTEQEVENVLGMIESEPQICREGTSLVLTFMSEGEVNEAVGQIEGTMNLDGGGYTIKRLEPATPSTVSTPSTPARQDHTSPSTVMSLDHMFKEVDSRVEAAVQKHTNVINANSAGIGKTLEKIEARQALQDKRQEEMHATQTTQHDLLAKMFQQLQAWKGDEPFRVQEATSHNANAQAQAPAAANDVAVSSTPSKAHAPVVHVVEEDTPNADNGKSKGNTRPRAARLPVRMEPYPTRLRTASTGDTPSSSTTPGSSMRPPPRTATPEVTRVSNAQLIEPGKVVHAVQGHGESAEIVTVRVLAASERDHTSGILAHKYGSIWSMEHGAVVGDDTPSGAIFISSDNVFEDPDAATDALQRHREAKKLKV